MIPRTFLIGVTQPVAQGLRDYLNSTGQSEFLQQWKEAGEDLGDQLCLVSFYAKLCYKSLVMGKNANVSRVRDIEDNIIGCFKAGHGSVFEHVWFNFVTTDCSRVFTHELVRHRVGTAFSQTSGRYCSIETLHMVLPPELSDAETMHPCPHCTTGCAMCGDEGEVTIADYVGQAVDDLTTRLVRLRGMLIAGDMPFDQKKRLTSAIRRLAPNGQANEIGWSCNIRSLRHMIEMRTSRAAEWEMRVVFNEVARIIKERWPLMLYGGVEETVDGLSEYRELSV